MKTLHLYVTVWFIELFLFVVVVSISQIIFLNFKHLNLFFIFLIWIFLLNMRVFWRNESGVTCFALRGIIACYLPWYLPKIASQIILFIFFLSLGSQLCCYNHQSCLSFYNVFLYYHVEPIFLKSQSLKKQSYCHLDKCTVSINFAHLVLCALLWLLAFLLIQRVIRRKSTETAH